MESACQLLCSVCCIEKFGSGEMNSFTITLLFNHLICSKQNLSDWLVFKPSYIYVPNFRMIHKVGSYMCDYIYLYICIFTKRHRQWM